MRIDTNKILRIYANYCMKVSNHLHIFAIFTFAYISITMKYNKLVRDNIPEVIKDKGKTPVTHIADEREFGKKLDEKLQEEINEFLFAKSEEEFADVLEVLDAIAAFRKMDKTMIASIKKNKGEKTGKFEKKIILDEVV